MKKVVVLLVDSLMPNILEDCMRHKTVPALQFLKERGRYWPNCVTVFPTMTASVDSSLVTGAYPDAHRVPGLIWYDPETRSIINYINGWKCMMKLGIYNCARNVLCLLNEKHLSKQVTTLFEDLARMGRTSASINAVVHRGTHKHRIQMPRLADLATGFRLHEDVSGPDVMTMGAMIANRVNPQIARHLLAARRLYGINDDYAVAVAEALIKSEAQPDFMLIYLPDNDHKVHKKNPAHAENSLIQVDRKIQQILTAFGSWERALQQCVFIVISDHGQTRIGADKHFNIDLDVVLRPFRVLQLGQQLANHDLVVANNERMAYIYPLKPDMQERLIERLSAESRIDIVAWKDGRGVRVREGGTKRELFYGKGGSLPDHYGNFWHLEGEWAVLDLVRRGGLIEYGDYPDALSRLYGALYSQDIPMIVINARPRYEFKSRYYPMHLNGGSHGSLHKYDSMIPLIVSGSDHPVKEPPRLVDLKQLVTNLLASQA